MRRRRYRSKDRGRGKIIFGAGALIVISLCAYMYIKPTKDDKVIETSINQEVSVIDSSDSIEDTVVIKGKEQKPKPMDDKPEENVSQDEKVLNKSESVKVNDEKTIVEKSKSDKIKTEKVKPEKTKVDKSNVDKAKAKQPENKPVNVSEDNADNNSTANESDGSKFTYIIDSIEKPVEDSIVGVSWNSECPVSLDNLAYLKISYLDFENKKQTGELIVHKKVAQEIVDIFKELYEAGFNIDKMILVDNYEADDTKSMEDNNTSAFNYRPVEGTTRLSKHSYGIAIDINPVQNPYVKKDYVSPGDGKAYLDRSNVRKGMIVKNDVCYKAFKSRGWIWGGEWNTLKDYQHFQKKIDINTLTN